jgi:hypothetical protein
MCCERLKRRDYNYSNVNFICVHADIGCHAHETWLLMSKVSGAEGLRVGLPKCHYKFVDSRGGKKRLMWNGDGGTQNQICLLLSLAFAHLALIQEKKTRPKARVVRTHRRS